MLLVSSLHDTDAMTRDVPVEPKPPAAGAEPPAATPEAKANLRRRLGETLVDEGLITPRQLDTALRVQTEQRPHTPIGQLLVEQGAIRAEQLDAVLDKYRLGQVLITMNAITKAQLEDALWRQLVTRRRLTEVLLQLRYVSEDQLREALARHFGIRVVPLDEAELDGELARLVDRDYARRHRLVPVSRAGDRLTVAMDDPGDRWVVEDLARITGCRIEVVTTPSAALRRALARLYGDGPARVATSELEARHVETRRILAAVRDTSAQVRQAFQADSRSPARPAPAPPALA